MKSLVLLLLIFTTTLSFAQQDSVAFFYSKAKVVVVINELNPYGRLASFIETVSKENTYRYQNTEQGLKISCSLTNRGAGCRFIFKPNKHVVLADRTLRAAINPTHILSDDSIGFEMTFNSSMNDKFSLRISQDKSYIMTGSKILRGNSDEELVRDYIQNDLINN